MSDVARRSSLATTEGRKPGTPSQTVGPYLAIGLPWDDGPVADPDGVNVEGVVYDGAGSPVGDALVEVWAPAGAFARCPTDENGHWHVRVPQSPYLAVHVFARGLLRHLTTRICFDESTVPDGVPVDRRDTLLPQETDGGYRFDIRIQGDGETVFFDL
jgi:protocatechuate 3,4-dioxygenase alpha subunit